MPAILLLSDDNRILRKRIISPSFCAPIIPRVCAESMSGANIARDMGYGAEASQIVSKERKCDDAYTIKTAHLRYLGNGVWISRGMSREVA